jgi:hypothetical protein
MSFRNHLARAVIVITIVAASLLAGQEPASNGLQAWVVNPEMRLTPASSSRDLSTTAKAEAFRNEVVSLQFAVRAAEPLSPFSAMCAGAAMGAAKDLPCAWVEIRYPGYILVDEIGQYTSDPLFEKPPERVEPNSTQGVWLTVRVPKTAEPGVYANALIVHAGSHEVKLTIELHVPELTLPDLTEGKFCLNLWQDPSSVALAAKLPLWSEEHWKLLEAYARDLAAHGEKSITTTIIHDPWRSDVGHAMPAMVAWRFPGQWQLGQESRFEFDFTVFDRYVELMMKAGIRKTIHSYSMVNGPGESSDCDLGYINTRTGQLLIRHTTVGDDWYKKAWDAFLPVFVKHLREKGWLDRTYIGFDEKPQAIMDKIMAELHAAAPGLKITLAGGGASQQSRSAGDLTIHLDDLAHPDAVARLVRERRGIGPTSFYTACSPHSPNTFLYSPLWESRLLPWIAFRHGLDGYLRWNYNYWFEGMWSQPRYHWHSGDMFFVYPGEQGPLASARWEMLRQGIQDFEALGMLKDRIDALKKQPAQAAQAARLEKRLKEAVGMGCELDDCENWPHPGEAREQVDGLLAEAAGLPDPHPSPYDNKLQTTSKFIAEDFVPDGNLDKQVWRDAPWVKLDRDAFNPTTYPQSEMEVASLWTATNVFFAFRCKYTTLNVYEGKDPSRDFWTLWDRDVVEVFLNPQPERLNHYFEYEVAPNNLWIDLEIDLDRKPFNDPGWESQFEHATQIDAQNHVWTCEMRIPVRTMGGVMPIQANDVWRINIYRADGPGDDSKRRFLSWSLVHNDKHSFHAPASFGLLRFVK